MNKPLVYLAGPYSHDDPQIKFERFVKLTEKACDLTKQGYTVFSPITHSHPMHEIGGLSGTWETWSKIDTDFLSCSHQLFVLCIDGWEESVGVQAEIKIAKEMGIPIIYLPCMEKN